MVVAASASLARAQPYVEHEPTVASPPSAADGLTQAVPTAVPTDEELIRIAEQEAHEASMEIITTTCAGMVPPTPYLTDEELAKLAAQAANVETITMTSTDGFRIPAVSSVPPAVSARIDDADEDGWSPTSQFSAQRPSIIMDRDRSRGRP